MTIPSARGMPLITVLLINPDHGLSVDEMLNNTDAAMYRATGSGRDRVISYQGS